MSSLTQTAYLTRRIFKYGTISAVLLIVGWVVLKLGFGLYRSIFPPPPPPPTVTFGVLPALVFPQKENEKKYSFSLQTPTGQLPEFPTSLRVYFMPQAAASFLDLDDATQIASSLGFTGKPERISETLYKFPRRDAPASITMNIVNKTFSLNYDLSATPELINMRPSSTQEALKTVQNFLSRAGLLTPDLAGEVKFDFIKVDPPDLVPAISLSESSFVRVNLFRQEYDGMPVLTAERDKSNVWFLVSGAREGGSIIAGEYHYFSVDADISSTYPLKTAKEAWEELTEGKGYVAQAGSSSQITVRRVYLAYYDSGAAQKFLQPIVVFEADGFSAYVPAVKTEYYGSQE